MVESPSVTSEFDGNPLDSKLENIQYKTTSNWNNFLDPNRIKIKNMDSRMSFSSFYNPNDR